MRFIASYDDMIKFCGTDESLAGRFMSVFAEAQGRVTTFDPIMVAASNPTILESKADIWGGKSKKRKVGAFDDAKFTKLFVKTMQKHLENPEKHEPLLRSGFDAYAYLMAHEEDIMALYGSKEGLGKLQMAALHYVETDGEVVDLDYVKYIASHDDLIMGTLAGNPGGVQPWEEFIPAIGKMHYDAAGRVEIHNGTRPVTDFFSGVNYIATYSGVQDEFKNPDGSIDETKAAIAYIVYGAPNGLVRNGFHPNVFLANYPELVHEDIYINNEVNPLKVAKLWLEKVKEGIDLSKFDPLDFKETSGLDETVDAFKAYVDLKVAEYRKLVKKQSKLLYRLCQAPRVKAPKAPEPEPEPEPEP